LNEGRRGRLNEGRRGRLNEGRRGRLNEGRARRPALTGPAFNYPAGSGFWFPVYGLLLDLRESA